MIDLQYYSPEELIEDDFFATKKVSVYVKRDDLIHPFISGNKWRKLKYVLRQALSENKKHLVTFGGAYSNHLLATACAAAKFGFKSTGIVRGEPVKNDTLTLCTLFGMTLTFVDRESYRDKELLFDKWFSNDDMAFFIDEGGSGPDAVEGCAELISELTQPYDHIICASGTGTTAAGILKGITDRNLPSTFHSVPVFKDGRFIRQEIEKYFDFPPSFTLHLEYHFGGYAKTQPHLLNFIQTFSSSTGILLDPVYTGKMFFGLYDLIRKNHFPEGSKILAVHTGGLLGLLGMTKKIQQAI
ncbi:1-aminocyclopropane-1-carboxylate deaminase/D-cysteine desulfhydrase [Flavihumibacter sp. R14]|nr:1-aminocyclopropane-1-carboxylate deaminase/D-cysteine desulfhydrase [Flavihumibacter soli]